ncbi:GDP-mannose 4,6-dehydratase [Candidatus Margulisiibacteriota bacterium]
MKNKNIPILITGCNGTSAYWLIQILFKNRYQNIYGIDISDQNLMAVKLSPGNFFKCSVVDKPALNKIIGQIKPQVVFHLAGVLNAPLDPELFEKVNVAGTENLLQCLIENKLHSTKVLIPGSSSIYKNIGKKPVTEQSPLAPSNPYGSSKLNQEKTALKYFHEYKLPVYFTRTFNNTAPFENESMVCSSLTKKILEFKASRKKELPTGNLESFRDITDTRDVIEAYLAIISKGKPGVVYNVCSEKTIKIRTILNKLIRIAKIKGPSLSIKKTQNKIDIPYQIGSFSKIRKETGWRPKRDIFKKTLPDLYRYWKFQAKPLKICLVGNASNIHEQRWIEPIVNAGHKVTIISDISANLPGVNLVLYDPEKKYNNPLSRFLGSIIALRKILKKIKPDILHIHFISGLAFTAPFLGFKNIVLSAWGSDILLFPKRSNKIKYFVKLALRSAKLLTAPAEIILKTARDLTYLQKNKTVLIRWSIDFEEFYPIPDEETSILRKQLGFSPQDHVFIHLRNLTTVYNVDILLKAFQKIAQKYPQAKLFLKYGLNDGLNEVKKIISELNIQDKVVFKGFVPHQELNKYLQLAQVGISITSSDGGMVSCLEAMAAKKPLILSEIPATAELLGKHGQAEIVKVRDIETLYNSMQKYLENRVDIRTMIEHNFARTREIGDHRTNIGKIIPLYREIVSINN